MKTTVSDLFLLYFFCRLVGICLLAGFSILLEDLDEIFMNRSTIRSSAWFYKIRNTECRAVNLLIKEKSLTHFCLKYAHGKIEQEQYRSRVLDMIIYQKCP